MRAVYGEIEKRVGNVIRYKVSGASLTTFKSGGEVEAVVEPTSLEELIEIKRLFDEADINPIVLGGGSNVLLPDDGLAKPILRLNRLADVSVADNYIYALAGARLPRLAAVAQKNGLSGLEALSGIPATLGGALASNAGAYCMDICSMVDFVEVLDGDEIRRLNFKDVSFGYRQSSLS